MSYIGTGVSKNPPNYKLVSEFTATAGQTVFAPSAYSAGYIDVFRNGVKLGAADFTATNGTTVTLANACAAGDFVRFESVYVNPIANAIPATAGAVSDSYIAGMTASKLSGQVPYANLPAGSVLQVVQGTTSTTVTNINSQSYFDTGLSASITPKFSTSKILVMVSQPMSVYASGANSSDVGIYMKLNRTGATGIYTTYIPIYFYSPTSNAYQITEYAAINYLDSPATTSSITYNTQAASLRLNQTIYANNSSTSTIILMEIAA